ncbi:uncharacterized protein LOC128832391 isoform X1 [Malaclemys terrapin pileata]|uniref:uncharacterized protein LOC128832391 isoform X1 n=1 Tax=Malaclemys terrapin pileata TaxID=2991368 RepID=UPI0023A8E67B|nr:uncharacterized protein LOC128832391 isoform X1 [Malaclemys terrapin pileata]
MLLLRRAACSSRGAATTTPPLTVDSEVGIISAIPEDSADREEEEEEEKEEDDDELAESTQHSVLPNGQDLFLSLTEVPSQPSFQDHDPMEGTSASSVSPEDFIQSTPQLILSLSSLYFGLVKDSGAGFPDSLLFPYINTSEELLLSLVCSQLPLFKLGSQVQTLHRRAGAMKQKQRSPQSTWVRTKRHSELTDFYTSVTFSNHNCNSFVYICLPVLIL